MGWYYSSILCSLSIHTICKLLKGVVTIIRHCGAVGEDCTAKRFAGHKLLPSNMSPFEVSFFELGVCKVGFFKTGPTEVGFKKDSSTTFAP